MKGTKMLNPMYSIATDGTIAYAEQIKDESRNKFQKDINDEQAATNEELQAAIDNINDNIPTDYAKETTAQQAASDASAAKVAAQAITERKYTGAAISDTHRTHGSTEDMLTHGKAMFRAKSLRITLKVIFC